MNLIQQVSLLPLYSPKAFDKNNHVMLCFPLHPHLARFCHARQGRQNVIACIPHSACSYFPICSLVKNTITTYNCCMPPQYFSSQQCSAFELILEVMVQSAQPWCICKLWVLASRLYILVTPRICTLVEPSPSDYTCITQTRVHQCADPEGH